MNADFWKNKLSLQPHPEGGFYRETYRSSATLHIEPQNGVRHVSTAIYFLLENEGKSHFHRIKSDELWFFHEGSTIELYCLSAHGARCIRLGKNIEQGEQLQATVPAGTWFAACLAEPNGFALVSCTVAPGFDFSDFELATQSELLALCPAEEVLILRLTLNP
jgi:predicted cupin superfamily sugar epimerase